MRPSIVLAALAFSTCATPAEAPTPQRSLDERLGGKDAIAKMVSAFLQNVLADARVNAKFASPMAWTRSASPTSCTSRSARPPEKAAPTPASP